MIPKDFNIVNSFKKGKHYGTSSSLPAAVACTALMKSVNNNLNTDSIRDIFNHFTEKGTIIKNSSRSSIGRLNFLEAVKSAAAYGNPKITADNFKYYFRISKDDGRGLHIEVFDIMGKRVKKLSKSISLGFYSFSVFNKGNNHDGDPLFEKELQLSDGETIFMSDGLENGKKYFLKITDEGKQINDSISVI